MQEKQLRKHLGDFLAGGNAHLDWKSAFAGIPPKLRGVRPAGIPYSLWELLEHLRIAQWDILEFSRNPKHVSPEWPAGYWPKTARPPSAAAWNKSVKSFAHGLAEIKKLTGSSRTDLFARIPHGKGQTILREILLVADHNAYHLGQVVLVRRLLGAWKKS